MQPIEIEAIGVSAGDFRNCATIALSAGRELNLSNNQSCVNGRVQESPATADVSIRKSTGAASPRVGEAVTFTLQGYNAGSSPIGADAVITIADTVPTVFANVSLRPPGANWSCSPVVDNTVACDHAGRIVGPGEPLGPILVDATANVAGAYENCATIGVRNAADPNPSNDKACSKGEVIAVSGTVDVRIEKSASVASPRVGETVAFTLQGYNAGSSPIGADAVINVADKVPSVFANVSLRPPGANWSCSPVVDNTVACDHAGRIVGPGESLGPILVDATANVAGAYENCATIGVGNAVDPNPSNDKACVTGEVTAPLATDLSIARSSSDANGAEARAWTVGDIGQFTYRIANLGAESVGAADGITVTDTLPDNLSIKSVSSVPGWSCPVSGHTATCTYSGEDLAPGASTQDIVIRFAAEKAGAFSDCATVALTSGKDHVPGNDRSCTDGAVNTPLVADLAIDESSYDGAGVQTQTWKVGDATVFVSTIMNRGTASVGAADGITVTDTLPGSLSITSVSSVPGWSCPVSGQTVTCTYSGEDLAPGASKQGFRIEAKPRTAGAFSNCVTVAMKSAKDRRPSNDIACVSGAVTAAVATDLNIFASGNSTTHQGDTVVLEIHSNNLGPTSIDANSGLTITDTFPSSLSDISVAPSAGWTCSVAGQTVTCGYTGPEIASQGALPRIDLRAVATKAGAVSHCATISIKIPPDPVSSNNKACINIDVFEPLPVDASIMKFGSAHVDLVGDEVKFELRPMIGGSVGPGQIDLTATDTFPVNFSDISVVQSSGWDCSVNAQAVTCDLSWRSSQGRLPPIILQGVVKQAGAYNNCATITVRNTTDPDLSNNTACSMGSTRAPIPADLSITEAWNKKATLGNKTRFSLYLKIPGPASVDKNNAFTITDTFPANFSDLTVVSAPGWTCSVAGRTVTCDYAGGTVQTPNELGVTVEAVASELGDFSNCATIGFKDIADPDLSNNSVCVNGAVSERDVTDLSIAMTSIDVRGVEMHTWWIGDVARFTLHAANNGKATLGWPDGVTVTDTAPDNFKISKVEPPERWSCSTSGQTVTCNYEGMNFSPGIGEQDIAISAAATSAGAFRNCATIGVKVLTDTNSANDQSCVEGEVMSAPRKTVDLSIDEPQSQGMMVGMAGAITLRTSNNGSTAVDASDGVKVVSTLPDNFSNLSVPASAEWNCLVDARRVACDYTGGQVAPQSALPPIVIHVLPIRSGMFDNCATISVTSPVDINGANDVSCARDEVLRRF